MPATRQTLQPVPLVPPAPESRPAERPFTVQKRVAVPERERSTPEVLDDLRADRILDDQFQGVSVVVGQ